MRYEGVASVDVVDLLEQLDIKNVRRIGRGEVAFSCPFVNGHAYGDVNPSNHINEEKLLYRCKSCHQAGTVLDLIGYVRKCSPLEALRWLRDRFGETRVYEEGEIAKIRRARMERWSRGAAPKRRPVESETIGAIFEMDWWSDDAAAVYMRGRGFSPELLDRWGFGFDTWTQRVTIPVHDEEGTLVGFKGRAISPHVAQRYDILGDVLEGDRQRKPRYGIGYGFDLYDPGQVVIGLHDVSSRRLVVCEGELNAYALRCVGEGSSVAIGTTTITVQQQRLLRWHADELVLFYDSDEAGVGATWGYYVEKGGKMIWVPGLIEKLSPYLPIRIVDEHDDDPAGMLEAGRADECRDLIETAQPWRSIAMA